MWTSADTDAVLRTERRAPHRIMPLYTLPDGPFVALEGTRGRLTLLSLLHPNGSLEPLGLRLTIRQAQATSHRPSLLSRHVSLTLTEDTQLFAPIVPLVVASF